MSRARQFQILIALAILSWLPVLGLLWWWLS